MDQAEVGSACLAAPKRRYPSTERCGREPAAAPPQPLAPQIPAEEEPQVKQRKTGGEPEEPQMPEECVQESGPNLLDFCDEVLIEIFQYLDTFSIMAMMHCSPRLENLLLDHRFYHCIDLSNGPLPMGILEEILGRATEKTHTIKICGPPSSQHVAGEGRQFTQTLSSVFPKVATQLRVLELQGVSLDFEYIHISEFPSSLKRLKLIDCSVKVGNMAKSIFHSIEVHLVELEDLSIEDNTWFEPYYIMGLSKLPSLRRLSLKGCQMLCKFVPYGSMAARFGFQKLESLDLRLTPINNPDLQCFSAIENLKELLLESPPNLPAEQTSAEKTNNGNATNEAVSSKPEAVKVLNDDEPSTSRAAMEHLRACMQGKGQEGTDMFNSDNCNERKEEEQSSAQAESTSNNQDLQGKRIRAPSESEDEDTSSTSGTSASSSDKSEVASPPRNGQNGGPSVRSPMLVITLPSVVADVPPRPQAADADSTEAPGQEPRPEPRPTPRAYIYVPEANENRERQHRNMMAIIEQSAEQFRHLRGNNPAFSRFLPRHDQVIYMNPTMNVLCATRRHRSHPRPNYDQVVQHPMFWNMLDPLDRDHNRRMRHRPTITSPSSPQYYVSDRAMYSFGRAPRPVQPDVVWIRNVNRSPDNRLERLSLRNYHLITNNTLEHLVQCSPNLVYIDVSGTSITLAGMRRFKSSKPECEVVANHLDALADVSQEEEEDDVSVAVPSVENPQNDQQPPPPPPPPSASQELAAP
ncbi:uncharacterized protein LOC108026395 [Drosophila biarmipes]|uniref:uncharacterized protein LOC108026395 n=1 Tax=Drosophila biarmipes TaxID=125945 RepID=UPI0007E70C1D|nr:uncharacterized protein LOC108026395 [Drosophila biarmipes]